MENDDVNDENLFGHSLFSDYDGFCRWKEIEINVSWWYFSFEKFL